MKNLLLVGLGGGVGSMLRYLCQVWFTKNYPQSFPWGTFLVNVLGCFLVGVLYAVSEKSAVLSLQIRLLLATGFCGGFTTFSSFGHENMNLLRSGDTFTFIIYTISSVVLGILGVFAGATLVNNLMNQ